MREGENMRYPNLLEVVNWNICGKPAIADHAGITGELLEAVLSENEELTHDEMMGISRLVKIPVSVLELPELVLMNCNKFQHKMKVLDLREDFARIKALRMTVGKNNDSVGYTGKSGMGQHYQLGIGLPWCRCNPVL